MINRSLAPSASRQTGKSLAHRIALPVLWALSLTGLGLQPTQAIDITNQLVSVGVPGDTGNAESTPQALSSADGRYSLFSSQATNLVDGVDDVNSASDVFLYDRVTDSVTLISHAAGSVLATASGGSTPSAISADGEWVLFSSYAGNLIAGVTDGNSGDEDVFLYQRSTGVARLVSRSSISASTSANSGSTSTSISADGEWVLFESNATDLVSGFIDTNDWDRDVFLYQRSTGEVSLVSRSSNSASTTANHRSTPTAISADGEWVLFQSSATDLVAGVIDINGSNEDVFLYQQSTGEVSLVSRSSSSTTTTANSRSTSTAISADGDWVLFSSQASDVVAGMVDNNGQRDDVILYQHSTGAVILISRAANSTVTTADDISFPCAMSADGEWVLFRSNAADLLVEFADTNSWYPDVFLYRRSTGEVSLVSRSSSNAIATANSGSTPTAISADGEWVLFQSYATDLISGVIDTEGGYEDVFIYQQSTGLVKLVSRSASSTVTTANAGSIPTAISADGEWVLFRSSATDLMAGAVDNNEMADVYIYQRSTGVLSLVSGADTSRAITANETSDPAAISADGEWLLFGSKATNLAAGVTDSNGWPDVFLYERNTGTVSLVSRSASRPDSTANRPSYPAAISADGEWVLFRSDATDLVAGVADSGVFEDVFIYQRSTGLVNLVSRSATNQNTTGNRHSYPISISEDGEWTLFQSYATDLVVDVTDSNLAPDVFLYQRSTGVVTLISRSVSNPTMTANSSSYANEISTDGEWVLFYSDATDVVNGVTDSNNTYDAFLYQRSTGEVTLLSHSSSGPTTTANASSFPATISADGEWVLFISGATNVVPGVYDGNMGYDVFCHQRSTGVVSLVTHSANNQNITANRGSSTGLISADSEWVLLYSEASNLVPGVTDTNGTADVFLYQRSTGAVTLISRSDGSSMMTANDESVPSGISADGEWVLFSSRATNVVAGITDINAWWDDVFLYQRSSGAVSLVSHAASDATKTALGPSIGSVISADGSTLLFVSDADDVATGVADANGRSDVFFSYIGLFADGFEEP